MNSNSKIMQKHGKTFFWASLFLKGSEAKKIYSIYAFCRNVDDIVDGLILVGLKGRGDEFGIGHHEKFSILEVAQLFEGEIEMIPERKGNRMTAHVITEKIIDLGWKPKFNLKQYIKSLH